MQLLHGLNKWLNNTFFFFFFFFFCFQAVIRTLGLDPEVAQHFSLFEIEEYNFGEFMEIYLYIYNCGFMIVY